MITPELWINNSNNHIIMHYLEIISIVNKQSKNKDFIAKLMGVGKVSQERVA